jgi:hypothetical protein
MISDLSKDELELLALVHDYCAALNKATKAIPTAEDLYRLNMQQACILVHYRKAKLDVALRATNSTPAG